MIYLDSSALVKLAVAEPESAGLRRWLAGQPSLVHMSSAVIRAEVPRAVWRADPTALPESYRVIRRVVEVELSDEVLTRRLASGRWRCGLSMPSTWPPR